MNKANEITDLRRKWEQLPSPQLEALLHAELEKPVPEDDVVLLLLHILEAREPDTPVSLTPREALAWQRYQEHTRKRNAKSRGAARWLPVAASLVLVVALLFSLLLQPAEADTFWGMLNRWKESVLQFMNPGEHVSVLAYAYETNHPGLQQVYDAVVELGITDPVVPMWIPEEYVLTELEKESRSEANGIYASFSDGEKYLAYKAEISAATIYHEYYKDDTYSEVYEIEGMTYNITKNNGWWIVVWSKENIECSIFVDCQEETLRRILDSIYTMEDD